MKTRLSLLSVLLVVGCSAAETESAAYQPAVDYESMSQEEMMAMMMEVGTPGPPHEMFSDAAGIYNVEMTMYESPDSEPMTLAAQADIASMLGGRYMMERWKGDIMGMPFEGLLIMGYDNIKEEYFSMWMDNMSTTCSQQTGNKDGSGAMHMSGTMYDFVSPNGRPYRSVSQDMEDGTMHMEMYDTLPDGTEWMVMSAVYHKN